MTNYIKVGDKVKLRSGKVGTVKALDWNEGKVVSAGVEVKDETYCEVIHQMIHNIEKI